MFLGNSPGALWAGSGHSGEGSLQNSQSPCLSLSPAGHQSPESRSSRPSQATVGLSGHAPQGQGLVSAEPGTPWQLCHPKRAHKGPRHTDPLSRGHVSTTQNEERQVHLVRIVGRGKGSCPGFKSPRPLIQHVTLDVTINLTVPQLPHLQNAGDNAAYLCRSAHSMSLYAFLIWHIDIILRRIPGKCPGHVRSLQHSGQ